MKNLEQIRASSALAFYNSDNAARIRGENKGDVVKGLSSLIINNGLLATMSFAVSKGSGYETFMCEICRFLAESRAIGRRSQDLRGHLQGLCDVNSLALQRATGEALSYLAYLKRFEPKD